MGVRTFPDIGQSCSGSKGGCCQVGQEWTALADASATTIECAAKFAKNIVLQFDMEQRTSGSAHQSD